MDNQPGQKSIIQKQPLKITLVMILLVFIAVVYKLSRFENSSFNLVQISNNQFYRILTSIFYSVTPA